MQVFDLRRYPGIHIRRYFAVKHTVEHILINALLKIFCLSFCPTYLLVHFHHFLPGFTFEPVNLISHADFLFLVVTSACRVLQLLIPALERRGQALKGFTLLLHGAGIHLLHIGLDDLHSLGACDIAARNHGVGVALAHALGAGQRADRINAAIL